MRALLVMWLFAICACGNKAKDDGGGGSAGATTKPAKGPTGKPRPQPNLTVTLDGKPVQIATALAWKTLEGDVEITASSVPVACDQVIGDMREMYKDEVSFDVRMDRVLQPDGSLLPMIRQTYYYGTTSAGDQAATGSGAGVEGQPTTLAVDFTVTGTDNKKLVVKGTIDAIGCAPPPPAKVDAMPSEMPATMIVAGKQYKVGNAMLRDVDKRPELILTSGGETCEQKPHQVRGNFIFTFDWFGTDKPEVGQIDMDGALLPRHSDQTFDKTKVKIDPAPPRKIGQVKVDADIKIGEYPVQIHGTVMPVICK